MKTEKTANEMSIPSGSFQGDTENQTHYISQHLDGFMEYGRYELNLAKLTMLKYKDGLIHFTRYIGDKDVREITQADIIKLKRLMQERGLGALRIGTVIWALRSFLNYCNNFLKIRTINPKSLKPPRPLKREVIFLTKEEVGQFVDSIDTSKLMGLRFRALVEIILGTGMRISEVLSLNRKDIPWESKEAKIVGKGNKERAVFFTDRALTRIRRYLEKRFDSNEAVFATEDGMRRLKLDDISKFFIAARKKAGMDKLITPHILRHTVATNLVFNGCPILHVKEVLGHELLDTTCKYYLGVDKEQAKKAHREYLTFNVWETKPKNVKQLPEKRDREECDGQTAEVQLAEEMERLGMEYIEKCRKADRPITITGLCLELDTTRQTLMDYERKNEFSDTVKRLKLHAENYAEETLYNKNGRAVVGAIFALKNFGWSDKMEFENSYKPQILSEAEREEMRERMKNFSE